MDEKKKIQKSPTDDLSARILALEAENAALKAQGERTLTLKVADGGGVSLYGLGQYPVTLYAEQWARVLDYVAAPTDSPIRTFLRERGVWLKAKGEDAEAYKARKVAMIAKLDAWPTFVARPRKTE